MIKTFVSEDFLESEAGAGIEAGRTLFLVHMRDYLKPVDGAISQIQFEAVIYAFTDLYLHFIHDTTPECYETAKKRVASLIETHKLD